MAKYLIRFDDINPRMDWEKFFLIKECLEKNNIKSILGVVPNCEDENLFISKPKKDYYEYLRSCKSYGDSIAQHGYKHKYDSIEKGHFGNSPNSEFAGHNFMKQLIRISKGKKILEKESIWDPIFMAPSHSFDNSKLKALRKLEFIEVLDGFSLFPYRHKDLNFIPQISSKPLPIFLPCISQLCIHINTIKKKDLIRLIKFVKKNHKDFICLKEINPIKNNFQIIDRFMINLFIRIFRAIKKVLNQRSILKLKLLCIFQRIYYRLKLKNIDINPWHLNGTFYCRKYKILALEIINNLDPQIYIDIGCGLGELLSKIKLNKNYKIGFDSDPQIEKANFILNKNKFKYFSIEKNLLDYIKDINISKKKVKVVSMLNFLHNINLKEFKDMITKYKKELSSFILLVDNIYEKGNEYEYNHHEYFINHKGLIKYFHKVDKLRSLYCIRID